jgi:DNA-binding MarR family transcriptional regulator
MALYQLCLIVDEIMRKTCREVDLSMSETAVLCALSGAPIECSRIARNLGRARQNVHRSLERLRERGFVYVDRYPDSDRIAFWRISEQGSTYLFSVATRFSELEDKLRERVSQFDATIVNLEVMVAELDREENASTMGLHLRPPKPRNLGIIPE